MQVNKLSFGVMKINPYSSSPNDFTDNNVSPQQERYFTDAYNNDPQMKSTVDLLGRAGIDIYVSNADTERYSEGAHKNTCLIEPVINTDNNYLQRDNSSVLVKPVSMKVNSVKDASNGLKNAVYNSMMPALVILLSKLGKADNADVRNAFTFEDTDKIKGPVKVHEDKD